MQQFMAAAKEALLQGDGVIWVAREADPGCSGRVDPVDAVGHCRSRVSAATAACASCGPAQGGMMSGIPQILSSRV